MDITRVFRIRKIMKSHRYNHTISILILLLALHSTNSFGFDGGSGCSPKTGRRGRSQIISSIPCDLTIQAYCNLPGSQYPWHAVRRFVHENQGLMKRMYGDVRHISVLRTEINNNDIDVDDIEETAARYSRSGWKKNKYLYKDYQHNKNNDVLSEPHFRPVSTTTRSTEKIVDRPIERSTTVKSSIPITTNYPSPISDGTDIYNSMVEAINEEDSVRQVGVNIEKVENIFLDINNDASVEENSIYNNSTSIPFIGEETIKVIKGPSFGEHTKSTANLVETATISSTLHIVQKLTDETEQTKETTTEAVTTTTTINVTDRLNETINLLKNLQNKSDESILEQNSSPASIIDVAGKQANKAELINSRPNEGISDTSGYGIGNSNNMEGQLYQDVAQKENPPPLNIRGVNACPVKEEVVAPFWANNTRGEVLALLNLYPFEQYVHWEKCTNEHKQMYCREGCRCEQQYRLHRLLAYDPHNECRGIFSDWFRFPSCCICKCYDIPLEYRVTSRSPRSMVDGSIEDDVRYLVNERNNRIDQAEDNVARAMYDHATEDWYRPTRSDDKFEDIDGEFDIEDEYYY